jgi:phospholipid N-methyltransferase
MPASVRFLRQTFAAFRTTGAVAPSSRFLASAMVRQLPKGDAIPDEYRVLEVGSGTGSLTAGIVKKLKGRGRVTLYEINPDFARHLRDLISSDARYQAFEGRIELVEGDVLKLHAAKNFDAIISGLPFNNFTPDEVRAFLEHFHKLLKPGGTLSFFEYVGARPMQLPFCGKQRRTRIKGIGHVIREFVQKHQFEDQIVPLYIPPARVRHLRFE